MADKYVTVAGAGAKSGVDWANAFDLAAWEADAEGAAVAGDVYYVEEGTYTLTGHWDTRTQDGTIQNPIKVIGVVSGTSAEPPTSSDWADGSARPLIAAAANDFISGDSWFWYNFRCTTTSAQGFKPGLYGAAINCYSNNSSALARDAFRLDGINTLIDCEAESGGAAEGNAFSANGTVMNQFFGCYAHDSDKGIYLLDRGNKAVFCIIDTCTTAGIEVGSDYGSLILNNSIYNCGIGIDGNVAYNAIVMNNSISDCTTGISWDAAYLSVYYDYNNYYNNTADTNNVTKGANATAVNPNYTDAAGGDFSLSSSSAMIGAAFSIRLGV